MGVLTAVQSAPNSTARETTYIRPESDAEAMDADVNDDGGSDAVEVDVAGSWGRKARSVGESGVKHLDENGVERQSGAPVKSPRARIAPISAVGQDVVSGIEEEAERVCTSARRPKQAVTMCVAAEGGARKPTGRSSSEKPRVHSLLGRSFPGYVAFLRFVRRVPVLEFARAVRGSVF